MVGATVRRPLLAAADANNQMARYTPAEARKGRVATSGLS